MARLGTEILNLCIIPENTKLRIRKKLFTDEESSHARLTYVLNDRNRAQMTSKDLLGNLYDMQWMKIQMQPEFWTMDKAGANLG